MVRRSKREPNVHFWRSSFDYFNKSLKNAQVIFRTYNPCLAENKEQTCRYE